MKHIDSFHCCFASLLVAKDQVNPVVEVLGDQR